ncbi:hypothetical protein [Cryobacterium roopkundense]|uniref:Uncharacterized protein n=1 Tax=Cryobacterium roopkundense TaxID=1001240 RepID=A0A7W8ZW75_9MICO|nr:hypothetical protein [Cryobacterium roopkundense]MBB5641373.1 hypothetical protein [Cryobacterium roopkundense]
MTTRLNFHDALPIHTVEQARERVFELVGRAIRYQLWLMLLDADGHQLPILIPIEGIPLRPEPGGMTPLATGIGAMLNERGPGGSVILALERPGSAGLTAPDQAWARELSTAFGKVMAITGMFVAHDDGVCVLSDGVDG